MKILVTGGAGFIGGILTRKLAEQGHDVYTLERYVTGRYVLGDRRRVKTVYGDLVEYFSVRQMIRGIEPDAVIHLAAITAVAYSYDHPTEVLETNFSGTINLAEACLREVPHLKHFLFAGTSEEYGNQKVIPIKEEADLHPNSPYSVSKVAADKYLRYLYDAYRFPVTILRNFNTYGRHDNTHFVVEHALVQMLGGGVVKLGDPSPVRDFLYIDDHVSSYLACLGNDRAIGQVFNFCTGLGVSIQEMATKIAQMVNYKGEVAWHTIPGRPLDISVLIGDNKKARKVLHWSPKYSLEKGLAILVKYWKRKLSDKS
jgi:dTDP-glucose 4,6-dehydratase